LNADPRRLRFLVEDFDDAAPAAAPLDACACARCRTDTTLRRCRAEAFEDGRRAALAEREAAEAAGAIRAAALADALAVALRAAEVEVVTVAETMAEALGAAVVAMVRTVLPAASAHLGVQEAGRIAAAVLPALSREPELGIEAPPDSAAALAAACAVLPPALRARTAIVPGTALRITWSGGQVRHDTAATLAAIDDLLGQFGLLPPPHPIPIPTRQEAQIDG
jgi:hypothetical protein